MPKDIVTRGVSANAIISAIIGIVAMHKLLGASAKKEQELRFVEDANEWPKVSILVPARNEQHTIAACLTALLDQNYPTFEIVVIDDNSTDATALILADFAGRYPDRVRTVPSSLVPEGWLGKTHALWQGFQSVDADAQWVLFVDADTVIAPNALRNAIGFARHENVDLLSRVADVYPTDVLEHLVRLELDRFYIYAAIDPFHFVGQDTVEAAAAVGHFILVRREAYVAVGGHAAIRDCVLEDVELARQFRTHHFTTMQRGGSGLVEQHPTGGLRAFWQSDMKSLFLSLRRDWGVVAFVLGYEWLTGMLPILLLLTRFAQRRRDGSRFTWLLNGGAVAAVFIQFADTLHTFKVPRRYALAYPAVVVIATCMTFVSAIRVTFRRSVSWRGRTIDV